MVAYAASTMNFFKAQGRSGKRRRSFQTGNGPYLKLIAGTAGYVVVAYASEGSREERNLGPC
ncbi:hypothetical protein Cflav_PD1406 [Pedosphaera parvula Ellin514]|uniref:Uncharacterized protein n=1 Tax=Pedosphaera parvula (strain Ellin514) TaxID=320771 RepID=B9XPH8_PEDPL|nr:hypothetical protein Cflav_PD1406 [Pedosphaera parvula Ellin514]